MKRLVLILGTLVLLLVPSRLAHAQAAPCQFVLGFKTLHDLDPSDIGDCVDNQFLGGPSGDQNQHTTKGLMAWRKADNWTAFTNGFQTWINGPTGLVQRLNTERFAWEGDVGAPNTSVTGATPVYALTSNGPVNLRPENPGTPPFQQSGDGVDFTVPPGGSAAYQLTIAQPGPNFLAQIRASAISGQAAYRLRVPDGPVVQRVVQIPIPGPQSRQHFDVWLTNAAAAAPAGPPSSLLSGPPPSLPISATIDVVVHGPLITVLADGKQVAQVTNDQPVTSYPLGLQFDNPPGEPTFVGHVSELFVYQL